MQKLKVILVGYPGSQHIVPITKKLMEKYMPGFPVVFLNYKGNINDWSDVLADYLYGIDDEKVILALDDYFLEAPIDMHKYEEALNLPTPVKLCECSEQEQLEYPVTTQFTIWDRMQLLLLLRKTGSPWDFEMRGSMIFNKPAHQRKCLQYDVHSALSNRWEGINWGNLSEEDKKEIQCI